MSIGSSDSIIGEQTMEILIYTYMVGEAEGDNNFNTLPRMEIDK